VQIAPGSGRRAGAARSDKIEIAGGKATLGSVPGDEGRDPSTEPVASVLDLPSFSIDALPYPGTPESPPKTGVSQAEAQKLCAARGARLCTDVEWERACRGPAGDPFPSGGAWDPTCASDATKPCVSGFGASSMGTMAPEWTANMLDGRRAVVKGSTANASAAAHRCAARQGIDPTVTGRPIGFRCCHGPAPKVALAAIESAPTFRRAEVDVAKLGEVFASIPELARIKVGPRAFKPTELAEVLGDRTPPEGYVTSLEPIWWSPVTGAEILVVVGRSKGGSFVVALHKVGEGYRLASSMILAGEQAPIALAYKPDLRREIVWTTSWGALGEGGAVTYRDDHRVVIVQR
jgi:hypothetical protein